MYDLFSYDPMTPLELCEKLTLISKEYREFIEEENDFRVVNMLVELVEGYEPNSSSIDIYYTFIHSDVSYRKELHVWKETKRMEERKYEQLRREANANSAHHEQLLEESEMNTYKRLKKKYEGK